MLPAGARRIRPAKARADVLPRIIASSSRATAAGRSFTNRLFATSAPARPRAERQRHRRHMIPSCQSPAASQGFAAAGDLPQSRIAASRNGTHMNTQPSAEDYQRIAREIASDASPVGIDAKKTHVMILFKLEEIERRLTALEARSR